MKGSLSLSLSLSCYMKFPGVFSPPPVSFGLRSSPSKLHSAVFLFALGGIVVLAILLLLIFFVGKLKRQTELKKCTGCIQKHQGSSNIFSRTFLGCAQKHQGSNDIFSATLRTISYFDFNELKKATANFHRRNLLGSGGFGPVYRGKLEDGRLVAVKTLSLDKSQQGESEFLAEVSLITTIQHKNLVRLLGCCSDGAQRLLVYEYMKNKSLDLIIFGKSAQFLDWATRFQIILGIARGLQYLHEDSHLRIIHRDIKASNILLDDKFQPKIGDFGLARFFPEDQAYLSTNFAGTLGYTAPEYALRGELSEKADIYSFGVLVLEIISCRKNTDLALPSEMQYLPKYAWTLYESSKVIDLVDPKQREECFVEKDVLRTIHVALLCLQPHANLRPHMSEIVAMLTYKGVSVRMPMKPGFFD